MNPFYQNKAKVSFLNSLTSKLIDYLLQNNLITRHQHGFLKKRSTPCFKKNIHSYYWL